MLISNLRRRLDSAFTAHCPCSSKDVHEAELHILFALDWNIDLLAAIDVAPKLFSSFE